MPRKVAHYIGIVRVAYVFRLTSAGSLLAALLAPLTRNNRLIEPARRAVAGPPCSQRLGIAPILGQELAVAFQPAGLERRVVVCRPR